MEIVQFIPSAQRRTVMLAAQTDQAPVLIIGASGTGKSALARWIHQNGPRSALPLINSSPDHSISIASQILMAGAGSLVLTEVAALPLAEQKVVLQFIKTKTIPHPENPTLTVIAHARIIALSGFSLESRAQGGLFNSELLQKLSVFRIETPQLLNRLEEFEDIVTGLLEEITGELHREHIRTLSPEAWAMVKSYEWPGNIRELRNVLRVAVLKSTTDSVQAKDFPEFGTDKVDFRANRAEFEKVYLLELLKTFDWQIDQACQVSRMDRATLLEKMKKFGISPISKV